MGKRIIYLDPGHGGNDPGAVFGSRYESHDVLKLGLRVREHISKRGHTVLMSRTSDIAITIASRTAQANAAGADLFVSLHRNAFEKASACGVEIWTYTYPTAAELAIAGEVLEHIAEVGVQSTRGIKRGNYGVLRETSMPAVLVELGFITNTEDNRLFDLHFEAYAEAIAKGILSALGEPWESTSNTPKPIYRIQLGAFTDKTLAEAYLAKIKADGYPAFIIQPADAPPSDKQ